MPSNRVYSIQSAVIPYRHRRKTTEILLITSLGTGRWVIPKGNVAAKLTPRQSAEKEAFEEAGISGRISPDRIGYYSYRKSDRGNERRFQVEVFGMQVTDFFDSWPEEMKRKREWMSPDEAATAVDEDELRLLITNFFTGLNR